MYDEFTHELCVQVSERREAPEIEDALLNFGGPDEFITTFRSDNAPEIAKAIKALKIFPDTSVPNKMSSKGYVENRVQQIKLGTGCILGQSGLPLIAWSLAIVFFCQTHNAIVEYNFPDGSVLTPYERKHGEPSPTHWIPFGALVKVRHSTDTIKSNHPFAEKTFDTIFVGWHVKPGGITSNRGKFIPLDKLLALEPDAKRLPDVVDTVDFVLPRPEDVRFPLAEAKKSAIELLATKWQAAQLEDIVQQSKERLLSLFDAPALDTSPHTRLSVEGSENRGPEAPASVDPFAAEPGQSDVPLSELIDKSVREEREALGIKTRKRKRDSRRPACVLARGMGFNGLRSQGPGRGSGQS